MILVLCLFAIISLLVSAWIAIYDLKEKDIRIKWLTFGEIALAITIAIVASFKDYKNDKQADRIENLNSLNNKLVIRLNKLTDLNNQIVANTEKITKDNRQLEMSNSNIVRKINRLANQIAFVTRKDYEENLTSGSFNFKYDKPIRSYKDFSFLLGGNGQFGGKDFTNLFQTGHPLTFEIKHNRLYISGEILDFNHNVVIQIDKNDWLVNTHTKNKINYDGKGFEVLDEHDIVIFSLDILKSNIIRVKGAMYNSENILCIFDEKSYGLGVQPNIDELRSRIKKLFVYTGNNWLHKRASINSIE